MKQWTSYFALAAVGMLMGCTATQYTVERPGDSNTSQATVLQSVAADAPRNDSYVAIVYYGSARQPTVYADLDSAGLVDATAAAGKSALQVVERALTPRPEH